ncbi:MAG: 4-hydroxy-3-methylbut-2-enyl diphosphate reductase [Planctomycetota bacterium]|jgi:4-hydroxy-3-methylbut-2-enyl diphosphate reductase
MTNPDHGNEQSAHEQDTIDISLANPRGFCAGVDRAIEIVKHALSRFGAPVYVLHEIVHNRHVLADLSQRGAIFVKRLDQVPPGSVTIFSAHGVAKEVVQEASERSLQVIDATCPLVTKVHVQASNYASKDHDIVLIGHEGHPEVEGTRGQIEGTVHVLSTIEEVNALEVQDPNQVAYVTQTTLSVDDTREVIDALMARFPAIQGPALKDICYATQNRQNAVREMVHEVELLLVVGSANSSNSNRLAELGERSGVESYLVDHPDQVKAEWFDGKTQIGVTAGASAPETLLREILDRIKDFGVTTVREIDGEPETVVFNMPPELC